MRFLRSLRLPRLRFRSPFAWAHNVSAWFSSPGPRLGVTTVTVVVATGAAVLLALVLMSRQFDAQGRDRAAAEATSLSTDSGRLATGDAFAGYIHMLRAADDAEVRAAALPSDQRTAALRRLLELNTNRFSGYAVVDLNGGVIAATDLSLLDAPASDAYVTVRASQGNANSDIVFPNGAEPYVDYATILTDPTAGAWAVLVARAHVDRLWQPTLAASVDGGKNVIISRDGLMATGVPPEQVGTPWRGAEFGGGAIQTSALGADSICGIHAIAADTKIDHGWNVASCLPTATALVRGPGWLSTALIAALAVLCVAAGAAGALWLAARREDRDEPMPRSAPQTPPIEPDKPAQQPEPVVITVTNVEARTVIDAYEARNARLAARIRESVQARLLVVSSRVEEALDVFEEDSALSHAMLQGAVLELDDLNEHELRAIGQELYPDLVRLGLPTALRALKKDVADLLEVDVAAEADTDSVDEESDRAIDMPRRLAMYRVALESVHALAAAGLDACTVTLQRGHESIWLGIRGHGHIASPEGLGASSVAIEAYGGTLTIDPAEETLEIVAELPVPGTPVELKAEDVMDELPGPTDNESPEPGVEAA